MENLCIKCKNRIWTFCKIDKKLVDGHCNSFEEMPSATEVTTDYQKGREDAIYKALDIIDDWFAKEISTLQDNMWYEEYRDKFIKEIGGEEVQSPTVKTVGL